MKRYLLSILLLVSTVVIAGLPPTATKLSGESSFKTTFNTDFGSLTGTRSGTTLVPNQTGTGSLVLSNSPVLVTPNIGVATGTSLALTSVVSASNLSGTNTGDLLGAGDNEATATVSTLVVPNKQLTLTGTNQYRAEHGSDNELANPNFEHSTVDTSWTISNATASAETAAQFEGKKSLSLSLSGALSLSQSSTINAARKSGVQMVASVFVKSDDVSDLQLCSLKNGAEDKCTVSGGYTQGSGWRQLTVSFIGDATSNGIKLKSTDTSGTVLVDRAFVGIGSPIVDFTPDNVYSASIGSTGVVTQENTDFINGNCSAASNVFTCTFNTGVFGVDPNCVISSETTAGNGIGYSVDSVGTATIVYRTFTTTTAAANAQPIYLICQKQGADYKTSKAYVATNSNTDWISAGLTTSDFVGFGTVSKINIFTKRTGQNLEIRGSFVSGTSTATQARINLKLAGTLLTSASTASMAVLQKAGSYTQNTALSGNGMVLINSGVSYLTFGYETGSVSGLVESNGSTFIANGTTMSIEAVVPIQGWQDSSVIVGSFQGIPAVAGVSSPKIASAVVSSGCVVSQNYGDNFTLSSGASIGAGCVLAMSKFTVAPVCTVGQTGGGSGSICRLSGAATSSSITIDCTGGTPANATVNCIGY